MVKSFRLLRLVLDAVFKAVEAKAEKRHARRIVEHRETSALWRKSVILSRWRRKVEFFREAGLPIEKPLLKNVLLWA